MSVSTRPTRRLPNDMCLARPTCPIAGNGRWIDAVQDRLAQLDRLRGIVVEGGRLLGVLQTDRRDMGDLAHMHELLPRRTGATSVNRLPALLGRPLFAGSYLAWTVTCRSGQQCVINAAESLERQIATFVAH